MAAMAENGRELPGMAGKCEIMPCPVAEWRNGDNPEAGIAGRTD